MKENLQRNLSIKPGQDVWVSFPDWRYGTPTEPKQLKVASVGRKYFEVYEFGTQTIKFDLKSLVQVTSANYKARVFLSHEDYESEKRDKELRNEISAFFGNHQWKLDSARMKQTKQIISNTASVLESSPTEASKNSYCEKNDCKVCAAADEYDSAELIDEVRNLIAAAETPENSGAIGEALCFVSVLKDRA